MRSFRNSIGQPPAVVLAIATALLASAASATQDQSVQLEIRQRGAPAIQLGLPALTATAAGAEHAALLHDVLQQDLDHSMVFELVDPRVYPTAGTPGTVPWAGWQATGARALILGQVAVESDLLVVDFRLFDVGTARQITGKRYSQPVTGLDAVRLAYRVRTMAHAFNDEAVLSFTGVKGVASSRIAFVSDRERPEGTPQKEIFIMDYDGELQRRITFNSSISLSPSFSPQGDRIAYQTYVLRNNFPNAEIHMIVNTGGRPRAIVTCRGTNNGPAFSPDGTRLALSSSCTQDSEIYTVRPDGAELQRLTRNPGADVSPSWSPNGRQIVFVSDRSGAQQLYVMDATGLNTRRLSAPGGQKDDPAWQPVRGELIAYTASTGGNNFDIFVYDLTTDRVHQLTRGRGRKEAPSWSPDGRQIVFEWARGSSIQIWAMGFDGSRQRQLTAIGNNVTPAWGERPS